MCEQLYVIISWCEGRESVPKEIRYRWILNRCKHMNNIEIYLLEDEAVNKEVYDSDYYWEKGANDIKKIVGKPINVVFCGTDYLGTNRFESIYSPESVVIYFDRKEVPISSTDIRSWVYNNWDYIPSICKDYYTKKVLVIGGESTGKSTLVQNLALAYNTNFVAEIGRETCEYAGSEDLMIKDDLIENLIRQKDEVRQKIKYSNKILFVDTDCLTTGFYCDLLLSDNKLNMLAQAIHYTNTWDLVLFLDCQGVEFIQDGTRNEVIEQERHKYSNLLKEQFDTNNVDYHIISGNYLERFNKCKDLIQKFLNLNTQW